MDINGKGSRGADATRYQSGWWAAALAMLLSLLACSPTGATASVDGAKGAASSDSAGSACSGLGAAKDREACLLALPEAKCKKLGPACMSLRGARSLEDTLTKLEKDIVSKARTRYASYAADDSAYLDDLQANFVAASKAWRAYRDAYCQAEPMVEGMSRSELEPLVADCQATLTRERIGQLEKLAGAIP